jgi:hypothetical protein
VTQDECEALFALNANASSLSPEWSALFVEAIVDFVVNQNVPAGYVAGSKAEWLISQVASSTRIRGDEIELLVHVLEEADEVPPRLSQFVLGVVKAASIAHFNRVGALHPTIIDRLRRVVFAKGGDDHEAVSRAEAEALFDVNDAMAGAPDDHWRDFFARAVGNAVLYVAPPKPDAAEELKYEESAKAMMADVNRQLVFRLTHLDTIMSDMRDGFQELWHWDFLAPNLKAERDFYDAEESLEADAQVVTADEAHWLLGRIARSGRFDANERALVEFLSANAAKLDPSIQSLADQLSRQAPHSEASAA